MNFSYILWYNLAESTRFGGTVAVRILDSRRTRTSLGEPGLAQVVRTESRATP